MGSADQNRPVGNATLATNIFSSGLDELTRDGARIHSDQRHFTLAIVENGRSHFAGVVK